MIKRIINLSLFNFLVLVNLLHLLAKYYQLHPKLQGPTYKNYRLALVLEAYTIILKDTDGQNLDQHSKNFLYPFEIVNKKGKDVEP